MKYFYRVHLFLTVFILFLSSAHAEGLSLRESIETALRDNPALRASSWRITSQEEELMSAKTGLLPTISIEGRVSRTNNPTYGFMAKLNQERFTQEDFLISSLNDPDDITDYQTAISFHQPLFVPSIYLGIGISDKELKARQAEQKRIRDEVVLNVINAYLAIQTSTEFVKLAHTAAKDAGEHKRLASKRYEAGTGLYSDVLRAEVSVKNAGSMLIKAEGNLKVAKRSLGLVLGKTGPVDIAAEKPVLLLHDLEVYLEASRQREDVQALELRHESSRKAADLERSVFIPQVGLSGSYNMHDHRDPFSTEGESYYIMGVLRWNLFDASSYYKIRKAEAKTREVAEHLAGLKQEVDFRINEAYTRVTEKEQELVLAGSVVKEAEEAVRLVRVRYENSLAPIVDLLDTQLMLDTSKANLVKAENEYMNAVAELYYQSGTILNEFLPEKSMGLLPGQTDFTEQGTINSAPAVQTKRSRE